MREGSQLDLTSMCVKVCKYLRKTFCLSNKQFSCQKRWRFEGKNRSGLKLNTHEVVSLRSGIFSTLNILNRFNSVDKTLQSSAFPMILLQRNIQNMQGLVYFVNLWPSVVFYTKSISGFCRFIRNSKEKMSSSFTFPVLIKSIWLTIAQQHSFQRESNRIA